MTNAKTEFLEETKGDDVLCAKVSYGRSYWDDDERHCYILRSGYTQIEFDQFLQSLDFEYDSGYGGQKLYGNIWYNDGTWSDRGEYDGSEWWEHQSCPPIPKECAHQKAEA